MHKHQGTVMLSTQVNKFGVEKLQVGGKLFFCEVEELKEKYFVLECLLDFRLRVAML